MKLKALYESFIETGIKNDPRSPEQITALLEQRQREYNLMNDQEKAYFKTSHLTNPFTDMDIDFGDPEMEVNKMIVGIDVDSGDLGLVNNLNSKGENIDLVVVHHLINMAFAHRALELQIDQLITMGIPFAAAHGLFRKRIAEIQLALSPLNRQKTIDAATLYNQPMMGVHTPADNSVYSHLKMKFHQNKPVTVADVNSLLLQEPEFQHAKKMGTGMTLVNGNFNNDCGDIYFSMTGGTWGPKEVLKLMANHTNIGTIVGMHIPQPLLDEAKKLHLNVIVAGHMASDSLGMNILLDEALKKAPFEIISFGGFHRVSRL
jgi:hypothetical protein